MPLVEISLVEGRTPDQLRTLISEITDVVERNVQAARPSIRVLVRELPKTHWAIGGETVADRDAARAAATPS